MILEELISTNLLTDLDESLHKGAIVAVVEAFTILFEVWNISIDCKNVRTVDDLFLDSFPVLGKETKNDCVKYEVFERHYFDCSKRSNRSDKEIGGLLEISDHHAVNSLENLKLIFLVPIGTIFYEFVALSDVLFA